MTAETPPDKKAIAKKTWLDRFGQTEIPLAVYATIFGTMALLWVFQSFLPELLVGLFTELLGVAFTLFIVDTLLVRSKTKRWKLVQQHVDYLIARNVNRLRDGLSARVFGFTPKIEAGIRQISQLERIRSQRAALLTNMETLKPQELAEHISEASLFCDGSYTYLNEKAGDLWDILNMKYSEYLAPELVSSLINLHTHIKDLCSHLRQYAKAEKFPADAGYYHLIGRQGACVSIAEILKIVNHLKRLGFSEAADLSGAEETDDTKSAAQPQS